MAVAAGDRDGERSGVTRGRGLFLAQVVGSLLILGLLLRGARAEGLLTLLGDLSWPWVIAALLAKGVSVTVREVRLWIALAYWRRLPFFKVLALGYAAGLVNNVTPARGGDLLAAALLQRELDVPGPKALAAVGITSLVEALVFAAFLLGTLAFHATHWRELLGAARAYQALELMTVLTVVAVFGSVVLVVVSRRVGRVQTGPPPPGLRSWVTQLLVDTGAGLSAFGPLVAGALCAVVQVAGVVFSQALLLPALGVDLSFPLLAVTFFVAAGSLAAVVLPQTMGAGSATAAVFVLTAFGASESQALAFAALVWVVHVLPLTLLGLGPLWVRLGRLRSLLPREAA